MNHSLRGLAELAAADRVATAASLHVEERVTFRVDTPEAAVHLAHP
jgi:hypothetical protein